MKVSEYLRKYKEDGVLPVTGEEDQMVVFWAGWLIGSASKNNEGKPRKDYKEYLQAAIQAAEFIERQR